MNIIFDFDGTVCDSFSKAVELANDYLIKHRFDSITTSDLRDKGIKKLIEERKLSLLQKIGLVRLARREAAKYINQFDTFSGLPEVLKELQKKNNLGILTSNSRQNAERFLENHNLREVFDFVYSNSNLFGKDKMLKKIHADMYIGDETRDIEAAKKAGIKSIAVIWGYESKNLLKKSKPDFLINEPMDLIRIIK